jgi:hypothetical protein
MALALTTTPQLKLDIRLAQAVFEFQADLDIKQKLHFNTYRTQIHKSLLEI